MIVVAFGASSGIAHATLRNLAKGGATLHLVGRDAAKLASVAKDLQAYGAAKVVVDTADLADLAGLAPLWDRIKAAHPRIDLALLAHGILGEEPVLRRDFAATQALFTVNTLSPIALLTAMAPTFEAQKGGTIAVISSVAGDRGRGSNFVYGSTKAALTTYVDGLRATMWRSGVRVVTVKPGFVATPMTAHLKVGALTATADVAGSVLAKALTSPRGGEVVYVPRFWQLIMLVIKALPDFVMRRLRF